MIISARMEEQINHQIAHEIYSSYLYLSMAAYLETQNYSGFAAWMKKHVQEELTHAMKFYDYLLDRMGKVVLETIAAPPAKWASVGAAFEEIARHEQKVTSLLNQLLEHAMAEKDYATVALLQWFISEQVEEEAVTQKLVDKIKMAGSSMGALMALDHQAGKVKD